ncbi:MAG TPA: hypothetical protein VI386_02755 [Candidatus Sulfotelmatobacter sp.]
MESLTRLVSESLARYGLDRPVDYRRLQWSRWFRCESLHSLLHVPSKPGVFALAEEVGTTTSDSGNEREGRDFSRAVSFAKNAASAGEADRHMLAVLKFYEDDDMAFTLDRLLSRDNPMSSRLASGRCFVRFVVIEDGAHRRSICNALNQWLVDTSEKATGIGAHFATSLERAIAVDRVGRTLMSAEAGTPKRTSKEEGQSAAPSDSTQGWPDSGTPSENYCPQPIPSGF